VLPLSSLKKLKNYSQPLPCRLKSKSRLHVISKQLSLKSSHLNELDSEALNLYEVNDITTSTSKIY